MHTGLGRACGRSSLKNCCGSVFHACLDPEMQTLSSALTTGLPSSSVHCIDVKNSTFDEADALKTHIKVGVLTSNYKFTCWKKLVLVKESVSIKSSEFKGQRRHGYIHSFSLANTSYKDNQSSQPVIKLLLIYRLFGDLQSEEHYFILSSQDPWKVGCNTDINHVYYNRLM